MHNLRLASPKSIRQVDRKESQGTDLAEKLFKLVTVDDLFGSQSALADGLLQEFGHLDPHPEDFTLFLVLHQHTHNMRGSAIGVAKSTAGGCMLTAASLPSNVLGNMLGNNFRATGNSNSMNGTIKKTENGINLNRSLVVRRSCLRSRRVKLPPLSSLEVILLEILISEPRSLVPAQ
jgi:hypothetical protein